jgi:hypothetical protein
MRNLLQPGLNSLRQPLQLRWIALLSLLLLVVMSTAQVCHTHNPPLQQADIHQGTSDQTPTNPAPSQAPSPTPDHCPLCMALHAAMPASALGAPEPVLLVQALNSPAADTPRIVRWHFDLAIRPPPAHAPLA